MSFVDDLEISSLDLAEFAGHEVVLTRLAGGDPVDCHADIIKGADFQPEGFMSTVSGDQIIFDFCLVEIVTAAARGDSVFVAEGVFAGTYTVESELGNDGYFQKVVVK
jgi:hypothetical protein